MSESHAADINRIASAIARELTPKGGPPPIVTVNQTDLAGIGGSVEIVIIVNGTKYSLVVTAPTEQKNAWVFELKMGETVLAGFSFDPATKAWSVDVGLPTIKINDNFTIEKVKIELSSKGS